LKCPKCNSDKLSVVDSRGEANTIRRRRECQECTFRFTTFERVELALPVISKKDGRRESFDIAKLKAGIVRACEKRPISMEQIDEVIGNIERRVHELYEKEVPSIQLGDFVMEGLKNLDHIAYIRFASVYQEFSDIRQFVETLESLSREKKARKSRQATRVTTNEEKVVAREGVEAVQIKKSLEGEGPLHQ
jgi:transcriptional repressor NrdR